MPIVCHRRWGGGTYILHSTKTTITMTRRPSAVKDDISNVVDDTDSDAGGINTTPPPQKEKGDFIKKAEE
jgi:hypothetical protein